MEKLVKLTIIAIVIITSLAFSFSNVCNVDINSQGGDFRSPSGSTVFFIDSSGNIVIPSQKGSASGSTLRWFQGNNNLVFGTDRSTFNTISPNRGSVSTSSSGFTIRNSANTPIAHLSTSGDIQSRGHILYDQMGRGSDSNQPSSCPEDGMRYCATSNRFGASNLFESNPRTSVNSGSSIYAENRDYFCNVNSVNNGRCRFDVIESDDCYFQPYFICQGSSRINIRPRCLNGECESYIHSSQNCGTDVCLSYSSYEYDCNCSPVEIDGEIEITCNTCIQSYCSRMRYRSCHPSQCQSNIVEYECDESGCSEV